MKRSIENDRSLVERIRANRKLKFLGQMKIEPLGPLHEDELYDEILAHYQRLVALSFVSTRPVIPMSCEALGFEAFGKISFKSEKTQFNLDCQLKGHVSTGSKMTIEDLPVRNTFNPGMVVTVELFDPIIRVRGILYECNLDDAGLSINLKNCSFEIGEGAEVQTGDKKELLTKYPEAQTNDEGQIALKYRQPGNVLLQGNPSGGEYVAVTHANICMAWVDPADADFILAKKDGCCGRKRQSFFLANESDVRRWTNRGGQ